MEQCTRCARPPGLCSRRPGKNALLLSRCCSHHSVTANKSGFVGRDGLGGARGGRGGGWRCRPTLFPDAQRNVSLIVCWPDEFSRMNDAVRQPVDHPITTCCSTRVCAAVFFRIPLTPHFTPPLLGDLSASALRRMSSTESKGLLADVISRCVRAQDCPDEPLQRHSSDVTTARCSAVLCWPLT